MEGFGIDKLLITLLIVMVLFGAKRIPEIGASLGTGIREFKRGMKDIANDTEQPARPEQRSIAAGSPVQQTQDATPEPKRLIPN